MLIAPETNNTTTTAAPAETSATPSVVVPNRSLPPVPQGDEVAEMLLHAFRRTPILRVPAAPGAGKTHRGVIAAAHLASQKLKILVTANTNGQAGEFASRLAAAAPAIDTYLIVKNGTAQDRIDEVDKDVNVVEKLPEGIPTGSVAVCTAAKAKYFRKEMKADILIIDEAWQTTYTTFLILSTLADTFMLVGDPGQIDPIVTVPVDRMRQSQTSPELPAPIVLQNTLPDACYTITLDTTRRLGPDTTKLIAPLYPFGLKSLRPDTVVTDADGQNEQSEIIHYVSPAAGGVADPAIAQTVADAVHDAMNGYIRDGEGVMPISAGDIAVCCAHNSQVSAVASRVPEGVLVSTVNSLQGLERQVVVVWDTLAGHAGCPEFNLDTGRLCVALSRHRTQLRWVTTETVGSELGKAQAADPDDAVIDVNIEIRGMLNASPKGTIGS